MTAVASLKDTPVEVAEKAYRLTALVAFITCMTGACLFFLYKEKEILAKIEELKGPEEK